MQPSPHPITDLDRTQIALMRLYERAIQCAIEAEAEEAELNGEDTPAANRNVSSNENEEITGYGNPSRTV
jgi:hypothetical protein